MAQPFIGQIILAGFNFAPKNWALCNGQIMPIAQNTALFSILGTSYGGNGTTTFGLPNLQGRTPVSVGQGPGLSPYTLGQVTGAETVTLTTQQIPNHVHALAASTQAAVRASAADGDVLSAVPPTPGLTAQQTPDTLVYGSGTSNDPTGNTLGSGGGLPHENRQPYLTISYCIALQGVYPSRN